MSSASQRATKPSNKSVGGSEKAIGRSSSSKVNSDTLGSQNMKRGSSDARKNVSRNGRLNKQF